MTPDRYTVTLERIAEVVEALRRLEIPADVVHSLSVDHWTSGTVVGIHINGWTDAHVELVDRIADHYGLPADDGQTTNYSRGGHLGETPVKVFCGRPEVATS